MTAMTILRHRDFNQLLHQVRDPQRRTWILATPTSIGDTAVVCALARDFVAAHGHAITLIVPPDHLPVTEMFPNRFTRVVSAERATILQATAGFLDPNRFELDMPLIAHPYYHGDYRSDEMLYLWKYPGRGGISLTDLFRMLLRLPWEAQLERPRIPPEWAAEAQRMAENVNMPEGKSVILFPANSSTHPQFPDLFWETLAARLSGNGLRVFTNMKGGNFRPKTMPVAGTTPIDVPIHLALPLVELAGRTVCAAHGMQFLQLLGGKFTQMIVTMPISCKSTDWEMNFRRQTSTSLMSQYMYPELCLDVPFAECSVPFDGSEYDLQRVAEAIADECFTDPCFIRRDAQNGHNYLEEHRDWLSGLVQPAVIATTKGNE